MLTLSEGNNIVRQLFELVLPDITNSNTVTYALSSTVYVYVLLKNLYYTLN